MSQNGTDEAEVPRRNFDAEAKMFEDVLRQSFSDLQRRVMEEHMSIMKGVTDQYEVEIGRMRLDHRKSITKQRKTVAQLRERQASQVMNSQTLGSTEDPSEAIEILHEGHDNLEEPPATSPATLATTMFPRSPPSTVTKFGSISQDDVQIVGMQELSIAKDTNGTGLIKDIDAPKVRAVDAEFDDGVAVERGGFTDGVFKKEDAWSHSHNRDGDVLSRALKPEGRAPLKPTGPPDDDPQTEMTDELLLPESTSDTNTKENPPYTSKGSDSEENNQETMSWILSINKKRAKPIFTRISKELFPEDPEDPDGSNSSGSLGMEKILSNRASLGGRAIAQGGIAMPPDGRIVLSPIGENLGERRSRLHQSIISERDGENVHTTFSIVSAKSQDEHFRNQHARYSLNSEDNSNYEGDYSHVLSGHAKRPATSLYTTISDGDNWLDEASGRSKTVYEHDFCLGEIKARDSLQAAANVRKSRPTFARHEDRDSFSDSRSTRRDLPSTMQGLSGMFALRDCWWRALQDRSERRVGVLSRASKRGMLLRGKRQGSSRGSALRFGEGLSNLTYRELRVTEDSRLQPFILHPHSRPRVTWSMIGIMLVAYDIVTVPLLVFEIPALPVWVLSLMTAFWTTDIFFCLITGFELNGQMEMRPSRVMTKYVKTWMIIDFFTVVPEWIVICYETSNPETVSRLGDTFRFSRIFRCARVIRVLKMRQFVEKMQDRLNSENSRAFFGILKHMVYIVIINHFLACAWYAIGNYGDEKGWVHKAETDMLDKEITYRYLTSLHWSLSQLHGTMEVHPYTIPERLFATVVLILAVLCASWIVSSITNMMIQVQQARESYLRDKSTLRRYLAEYKISTELSMQVKSYADELLERQRTKAREVHVLAQLPPSLRMDIEYEIHSQTLHVHALFHAYCSGFLITIRTLCHSALTTAVLFQGNQVFTDGEVAKSMYFVIDGSLTYAWKHKEIFVSDGEWMSESVLWIHWVHCGDLTAAGMCNNMLTVNADAFLEITMQHRKTRLFTASYAEAYVTQLNLVDEEEISDIFYVNG